MSSKEHSKGFGTIGVLLTIVVIALAAGGAWYVYQHKHSPNSKANNGNSSTDTGKNTGDTNGQGSQQDTDTFLSVSELGVKLKLTNPIKDAYYKVKDGTTKNGKPVIALYLHSWDVYPNCAPDKNSDGLAEILTYTPGDNDPVNGDMDMSYPDAPLIDGLHYYIAQEQSDCSAGAASNRQAVKDAFTAAYKTIEKQ